MCTRVELLMYSRMRSTRKRERLYHLWRQGWWGQIFHNAATKILSEAVWEDEEKLKAPLCNIQRAGLLAAHLLKYLALSYSCYIVPLKTERTLAVTFTVQLSLLGQRLENRTVRTRLHSLIFSKAQWLPVIPELKSSEKWRQTFFPHKLFV